jgi:hypothetical protein
LAQRQVERLAFDLNRHRHPRSTKIILPLR